MTKRDRRMLGAASIIAITTVSWGEALALTDEIIVTARFREESLQDTPLAITAATGEALEAKSVTNVQDLGRIVPNAFITPGAAATGATPAVSLRGVFQSDFNFAFEPGVGIYIDDVYHSTLMGSALDLMDIERVEVLRGPQGTRFGKNTLGGAIQVISKKPEGDNSGSIEVGYGSFNRVNLKGAFDVALIPDRLFMRASGVSKRVDGYQKIVDYTCEQFQNGTPELAGYGDGLGLGGVAVAPGSAADLAAALPSTLFNSGDIASMTAAANGRGCGLGSTGGEELNAGRIMFRATPNDKLEINITGDYTSDKREVNPDTLLQVTNPVLSDPAAAPDFFFSVVRDELLANYGFVYDQRFVPSDPYKTYATNRDLISGRANPNSASVDSWGVSGKIDYEFTENLKAKLVIAHREYDSDFSHDADVSPFGFGLNGNDISHEQTTGEFQLLGQLMDGMVDWTVGAYYLDGESHLGGPIDYVVLHFIQNDTYKDEAKSGFGHVVIRPNDRLSFSGGVRYSVNTKEFTYDHINSGFPALTLAAETKRVDWNAGIDYKVTDDLLVYGVVATGFRPRSVNPRPITPNQFAPIPGEDLRSYEIGIKSQFFDRKVTLNLAGFYSDYKAHLRQLNGFECFDPLNPVNPNPSVVFSPADCAMGTSPLTWFFYVGEQAKIKGIEAEYVLQPTDRLTIDGAIGYNDFSSDGVGPAYFDPSNRIQPKLNASAGIQYAFDVPGGVLTPRIDWRYESLMTYNPAPTTATIPLFNVPAHSVFDARVAYVFGDGDWEGSVAVTNFTDEFYYNNKFTLTGFNVSGQPSRPREWRVSVKRNF